MKKGLLIIVLVVVVTATVAGLAVAVIFQGNMIAKLAMPLTGWSNSGLASYFGSGSGEGVAQDASIIDPGVSTQALQSRLHCEEQDNSVNSDTSTSY